MRFNTLPAHYNTAQTTTPAQALQALTTLSEAPTCPRTVLKIPQKAVTSPFYMIWQDSTSRQGAPGLR